jgi:hypothetical protein
MLKLSLDNPFVVPLAYIFFGLLGYIFNIKEFNNFDILFVLLVFFLFLYMVFVAEYIERKNFPYFVDMNNFFCWFVIVVKVFFLMMLVLSGPVNSFDDRLTVFGSSFLLGINNALSIFLFPLIPALTKRKTIFWACIAVWLIGSAITLIYAPSKSYAISLIFSVLFYRFLKRKIYRNRASIPLFSLKSLLICFAALSATYLLVYSHYGSSALNVILHRASYNYDLAIYISSIYDHANPDHGVFYYSLLPLLKQFNQGLYDLQFFSIPQWAIYEALGIERYGRFGYPNDNLVAGLVVSYGIFSIPIFFFTLVAWLLFITLVLKRNKISLFFLYLVFQLPQFYSSLQDFSIYFLVVSLLYLSFSVLLFFLKGVSMRQGLTKS